MLDFHARQLFKAKQGKNERVTDWIHKIQTLGSQFHEAALLNCNEGARGGILDLADRLRSTHGGIVHIIKKDRLSVVFRRYFIRVEAAVQLGIAVPPLPTLRPGAVWPVQGQNPPGPKFPGPKKRQEGPKYRRVFSVKRCLVQEGRK